MCGITALFSSNVQHKLVSSLKELQNRGYDSAGISYIDESGQIKNIKYASTKTLNAIDALNMETPDNGVVGIGHTRWATHGAKETRNSHPHISNDGRFHLVHNGIIENYNKLKEFLTGHGYIFKSETDTEVIVNLIQYYYNGKIKETLNKINHILEGSWAIVVLYIEDNEPKLCGTKNGSPLLLGQNGMFVSEVSGFCNLTDTYGTIENYQIIEITQDGFDNSRINFVNVEKTFNRNLEYPHWTLQEIYEQAETSLKSVIIDGRIDKNGKVILEGLNLYEKYLTEVDNLILVGCGTSFNACLFSKYHFKPHFNSVQVINASEFDIGDIPKLGETVMIFASQSGETRDVYRCLEIAKNYGIFTIGVVNVRDSLITREVHCGCYINVGREVGVASTKSFTGQIIVMYLMAAWFGKHNLKNFNLYDDIKNTIKFHEHVKTLVPLFDNCNSCFILGKGQNYALAREGALKIKEISYIHAEAYELSELKHGPFALLTDKTPVIIIGDDFIDNCYNEVKTRGSPVIVVDYKTFGGNSMTYVIILQLLAYELSIRRELDPDKPRNLAKVVTVS
tara:strand:+ start:432 stop:2129 length:1698 start_codon:yes stop_codon:yes gene_type:complete